MRTTFTILALALALAGCKRVMPEDRADNDHDHGHEHAFGSPHDGDAMAVKPALERSLDVAADSAPQSVQFLTRDFAPGDEIPWHTHPGVEMGYVESGTLELRVDGKQPKALGPGESFEVARGIVHGGANTGDTPARVVLTYVVDTGAPIRAPAEAPE